MADSEKKGALGELVKAESMIQLAIALPAGCVIGWLIGAWLDRHFHQNWMGIAGIVLGAIGGFRSWGASGRTSLGQAGG